MTNPIEALIAEKGVLLADGATGTNLFAMGLEAGEAPELLNETAPETIAELHQGFVDAGADIILTNSFGGTRHRLKLHHAQDRVYALNKKAAEIARGVADKAGRKVIVAGSVGPTGELLVPLGAMTYDEAVEAFAEQIEGLKAGGAEIAWIETMSAPDEIRAAAEAAIRVGLPYTYTGSFDTAGRTMMGLLPKDIHGVVDGLVREAARRRRQLRRRRIRHPGVAARHDRGAAGCDRHRQGQLRHSRIPRRRDPLFRHAGTDGRLCQAGGRRRRKNRRRLLRHDLRPPCRDAPGARCAQEGRAARPSQTIVERIGPMRNKQATANTAETSEARRERRRSRAAERPGCANSLQVFQVAPRLLQDLARLLGLRGGQRAAAQPAVDRLDAGRGPRRPSATLPTSADDSSICALILSSSPACSAR